MSVTTMVRMRAAAAMALYLNLVSGVPCELAFLRRCCGRLTGLLMCEILR